MDVEGQPRDERPARHRKRLDVAGDARYLTCSCFRNRPFLRSDRTCTWFTEALVTSRRKHGFALWAWVVMPTHFHLLVLPPHDNPVVGPMLSTLKQPVTRRTISWVRKNAPDFLPRMIDRQPNGEQSLRFWQRNGGYDRNLWSAKHIWETIDYIHMNPVEAGLVKRPEEWRWSSAGEYLERGSGLMRIDREKIPGRP